MFHIHIVDILIDWKSTSSRRILSSKVTFLERQRSQKSLNTPSSHQTIMTGRPIAKDLTAKLAKFIAKNNQDPNLQPLVDIAESIKQQFVADDTFIRRARDEAQKLIRDDTEKLLKICLQYSEDYRASFGEVCKEIFKHKLHNFRQSLVEDAQNAGYILVEAATVS